MLLLSVSEPEVSIDLLSLFFSSFFTGCIEVSEDTWYESSEIRIKMVWIGIITAASWLLSIILWPFALQSPVRNVLESYRVMAHFPDTFRQIFEGKVEWSDFMPWYYLLKSMLITIPLLVIAGFCLFFRFLKESCKEGQGNSIFFYSLYHFLPGDLCHL